MEDRERTNTKLVRKLGSRFSAKPQNTIRVLVYWNDFIEFLPRTAPDLLEHFKEAELADGKLELLALS